MVEAIKIGHLNQIKKAILFVISKRIMLFVDMFVKSIQQTQKFKPKVNKISLN